MDGSCAKSSGTDMVTCQRDLRDAAPLFSHERVRAATVNSSFICARFNNAHVDAADRALGPTDCLHALHALHALHVQKINRRRRMV